MIHLSLTRPAGRPPIDYQSYWKGEDLPQNTTINFLGVAEVPSGFHHFWGYVSPLRNAATLSEIENYPLCDFSYNILYFISTTQLSPWGENTYIEMQTKCRTGLVISPFIYCKPLQICKRQLFKNDFAKASSLMK